MPEIRPYGAQCDECDGYHYEDTPQSEYYSGPRTSRTVEFWIHASICHTLSEELSQEITAIFGWYVDGRNMVCPNCRPEFEERKVNPIVVVAKSAKVEE